MPLTCLSDGSSVCSGRLGPVRGGAPGGVAAGVLQVFSVSRHVADVQADVEQLQTPAGSRAAVESSGCGADVQVLRQR